MFPAFQRPLLERQIPAILDHRPLRVGRVCYRKGDTVIDVQLLAALSRPGVIRKLETELIGLGPSARAIYAKGNDDNTVDVALFARRDGDLRNAREAHGLCESRIWMHKAAICGSRRQDGRGLIHKKPLHQQSEAAGIFRVVQGFDLEDSKALVRACGYGAIWRFIAFAYARRPIGYYGRIARTPAASK